ncbi:MAG: ferritin family protein [bacterium]
MTNEQLRAGLKEAMLTEMAGIEFYTTAAEKTIDPQGRRVFALLADEERKHLEYLKRQYGHLMAGSRFESLAETSNIDPTQASPIFSSELTSRLKTAHWEMSALAVGLALEQASIQRYRELATSTPVQELKDFFSALVRWEETHAAAVQKQINSLRESYWEEARFAPF